LRFVATGPDGALYVATDGKSGGDEIWRVVAN
jgi:glucose/arabinose dehydrogenase